MVRSFVAAGLAWVLPVCAWAQSVPTQEGFAMPERPAGSLGSIVAPATNTPPDLVIPSESGPRVDGPHPEPIGFDLTYADRASATAVASDEGPAGPTDTASVAWPAVASANGTVLMAVQSKFRVTDRCGNTLREASIAPFVGSSLSMSAPSVIYTPWVDRWAMLWLETDLTTQVSNYVLVVTTSAGNFNTATWVYYRIPARSGTGATLAFADSPRLGYGPRGLSIASDQFRFTGFTYTGTQTLTISNDVFMALGTPYRVDFFADTENLLGIYPAKLQSSLTNLDAVFVATRRAGGSDIWIWRVYDAFGTRTGTPTTMPVAAYSIPPAVLQPEGRTFTRGVDCRLRSAVVTADGGAVKLHIVHNTARADPTQQAMIFAHRIALAAATVEETAFYVYGGNPEIAMFAPTVAMSYQGTRAIGYTFSSPSSPPTPIILLSNPSLTYATATVASSLAARNATAFGYGMGLDFDWNDYFRYGSTAADRFVVLGQYTSIDSNATPTRFASYQNEPAGTLTYTGANPIVFRKPPGASAFSPSAFNVTIGNTYATEIGVEARTFFGASRTTISPTNFALTRLTGSQVVQVRPGTEANTLPLGRWTDRVLASPCGLFTQVNVPVYYIIGCIADIDDGSGTGTADGGVTIDDLLYFLDLFGRGNGRADIDDGSGTGTPDGGVTIEDLLYYLERFDAGC